MLVHFGFSNLDFEWSGSVLTIGTFDGMHLGHQTLLEKTTQIAKKTELPSILVTFDRHPFATLFPHETPFYISSLDEKLEIANQLNINICVILPFDKHLALMSAESFFQEVLLSKLKAHHIVIGHDFSFGKDRSGNASWLEKRIPTTIISPITTETIRISSQKIRNHIVKGEFTQAKNDLGHSFIMKGIVVRGEGMGRKLGFPTLNIARSFHQVLPKDGVYAGLCKTSQGLYQAAISIGCRPTFGENERVIEAHLLDYTGPFLYGELIELKFESFIRKQEHFSSVEELIEKIKEDVRAIAHLKIS